MNTAFSPDSAAEPRIRLIADPENSQAWPLADRLSRYSSPKPNLIVVIGGDGFMLRTILKLWRQNLPFFGINVGHRGFLLNEPTILGTDYTLPSDFTVHCLPLLKVEVRHLSGKVTQAVAFNDAWVERAITQTAWVKVSINGKVRIPKLVADGVLVATPAGSTAYAKAMGALPLPIDAHALVLAGNNVYEPDSWKAANLPVDSRVELSCLDPHKRPITGVVDGKSLGKVLSMSISVHPTAGVALAFCNEDDLHHKLAAVQFPL